LGLSSFSEHPLLNVSKAAVFSVSEEFSLHQAQTLNLAILFLQVIPDERLPKLETALSKPEASITRELH
jgi:hypothetical protein